MKRKLAALLAAFFLLAGLALPAAATPAQEDEAGGVIRISSAEELLTFAKNCELDSWSQDKEVLLTADLSLEGLVFAPIPTFGGSFDGGGHTISGLCVEGSFSPAGLFATLQPTALVKDLTVEGRVAPAGDGLSAGGIAGENYGRVENCLFSGWVEGRTNTGGVAGINHGALLRCRSKGSVSGHSRTGGIAGYNAGEIRFCRSSASVNTESVDPAIDPKEIRLNFSLDLAKASDLDTNDAASDTGGIAGYSSGTVSGCVNAGSVGYPHIGYNLGGIAGRSSGLVESCRNEGFITGRKDAGGIVGQLEPHIQTILSPDYLDTLSRQFDYLGTLLDRAGNDGAAMGDDIQARLETLTGYQRGTHAALEALVTSAADGRVNKDALSDMKASLQGMANTSVDLRGAIGQGVDDLTGDISAISGQINAISRTFSLASEDAKQEKITDLSTVELDDITEGRTVSCTNSGAVEADLNAGGIAGIMGLESGADPEDDAPGGSLTQRRRYELKLIAQDCENLGSVTAKRSYVGGICGRMEMGLISGCSGFGAVSSENGDYVGGIAGLTGGTIRGCFAKCTLSGSRYIGGITGSGIAEDYSGGSSTVSDCWSMVEIPQYEEYAGAIAGANAGVFTGNRFVSDTLAGINRVSYDALAEPISYEELHREESLPASLKRFTLSFTADGKTLKTIPFRYGESFDDTVYPALPQKEGYYAEWSTASLTDLRFDTVVEAAYHPYITSLSSQQQRGEEKPVLFVEGQFKAGDDIAVAAGTASFPEGEAKTLLESWHISIPADGQESHTIRYLPEQEDTVIYLLKNGSWARAPVEAMGSYLAFEAAGPEVEFAAAAEPAFPWLWAAGAGAALLAAGLLGVFLAKRRKPGKAERPKKKKRLFLIPAFLFALAAGACLLFFLARSRTAPGLQAYDILKSYLDEPEQQMQLTVKAQLEDRDIGFSARISRASLEGRPVTAISEGGRSLYYADGVVFLKNGAAFRLNNTVPDYSALLETLLEICKRVEIRAVEGVCTITAEDAQATEILRLLMPSAQSLLPEANRLTVDLVTADGALSQIRFTGAGNLTDSVKTPFSLSAVLEVLPPSAALAIPEPVALALTTGDYQAQDLYSDDIVRLMDAWAQLQSRNPAAAAVTLDAACGELTLRQSFNFYRWKVSGETVRAIEMGDSIRYFTADAVCGPTGRKLPALAAGEPDPARLVDIALESLENAAFTCRQEGGESVYTFTLNQTGMKELLCAVFPKAETMDLSCDEGSIELVVGEGGFRSVAIVCGGSGRLLAVPVEVSLRLDAELLDDGEGPSLPQAVQEALLAE